MNRLKFIRVMVILGVFASLSILAGCGGEDPTTNAANARSDADLQALADQAAASSGITNWNTVDATNAGALGENMVDSAESIGSNADPNGNMLMAAGNTLVKNLQSRLNNRFQRSASFNAVTESYPVNQTYSCGLSGNTVVNGVIVLDYVLGQTSGHLNMSVDNMSFAFNGCKESGATYTIWGELLLNLDDNISYSVNGSNINGTFTLDEYLDGGLAVSDGTNNYNFIYSFSAVGGGTGVNSTLTSVDVTVTMRVGAVTCTAHMTDPDPNATPSWSCN